MATKRIAAIVQARMGSSRLPGKVLADIEGVPLIGRMLERIARAELLDELWVAISEAAEDDPLADYLAESRCRVFRGSETDVLARYAHIASGSDAHGIVRLTGDCPLIDPRVIDQTIAAFLEANVDYLSNCMNRTYPDGLDCEVMTREALLCAHENADMQFSREHVTPYIRGKIEFPTDQVDFRRDELRFCADFSHLKWSVDYPEDLDLVRRVFRHFLPDAPDFGWLEVVALQTRCPELLELNADSGGS